MTVNCPHCGQPCIPSLRKAKSKLKTFNAPSWVGTSAETLEAVPQLSRPQSTAPTTPGYRETPVRAPRLESDVWVPLLQSLIPSTCACILTSAVWLELGFIKPGLVALASFVGTTAISWQRNRTDSKDSLWQREEWEGKDLDGDGHIGNPDRPVILEIWSKHGVKRRDVGLSESEIIKVAEAIFGNGSKFSRRALCEGKDKCFPGEKYTNLVEHWVELGLLERVGDSANSGVALTENGLAFLGKRYDPPTPMEVG